MKANSEPEYRPYSFRVDEDTDKKLTELVDEVSESVPATRRRSIAIRDAIRVAWDVRFGKGKKR